MDCKSKKIKCDCQDDIFFGFPCRHQLALFIKQEITKNNLFFEKRWEKTYYIEKPELQEPQHFGPYIQVIKLLNKF